MNPYCRNLSLENRRGYPNGSSERGVDILNKQNAVGSHMDVVEAYVKFKFNLNNIEAVDSIIGDIAETC